MPDNSLIRPRLQNFDGTYNVYCRSCGRLIAKRADGAFTSIQSCALCEGGSPEQVLPQYTQSDITRQPIPLDDLEPVFLYEDEKEAAESGKPWSGMLKPFFRFLGFAGRNAAPKAEPAPADIIPESRKIARRKKSGGLFER